MAIPTDIKYIVTDPEVYGGRPIIAGRRIAVIDIAIWTRQGMTPEQIAAEFPLTLAQIHAALAYYYDHREELDKQLAEDEARLAAYAAQGHSPIMEKLRERTFVTGDWDFLQYGATVHPHLGVIIIPRSVSFGFAIEYLLLLGTGYQPEDVANRIIVFPNI